MARRLEEVYPGQAAPSTPEYFYGAFRNVSQAGELDGTPLDEQYFNDYVAFFTRLLQTTNTVPNDVTDTALNSQLFSALLTLIDSRISSAGLIYIEEPTTLTIPAASVVVNTWTLTDKFVPDPVGGGPNAFANKIVWVTAQLLENQDDSMDLHLRQPGTTGAPTQANLWAQRIDTGNQTNQPTLHTAPVRCDSEGRIEYYSTDPDVIRLTPKLRTA